MPPTRAKPRPTYRPEGCRGHFKRLVPQATLTLPRNLARAMVEHGKVAVSTGAYRVQTSALADMVALEPAELTYTEGPSACLHGTDTSPTAIHDRPRGSTMTLHRAGTPGVPDYRVEVPASRLRLTGILLLSLIFVLGCGALMVTAATQPDTSVFVGVMGAIGFVFFGAALVFLAVRLTRRGPVVVLDADGLHDHAAWAAAGTVPWSNIVSANVITIGWQSQLAVAVHDPQAVVNNTSGLRRLMLAANARMTTPVNIPGIVLPVRPAELATEINSHVALLSRSTADGRDA